MNEPRSSPFAPGTILAGKYRIERVLGQGGMGVVLAARHIHLEELVAVKLMLAEASQSQEAVARFVREARAAARLESAHVARVSDVGTLDDGSPYMVMEYLDGQDLSQLLASAGPLAVQDVVDYVLQAAEAIAEAHSIGIVHRDLKPSNLFLARRRDRAPHIKVLDFGISKMLSADQSSSQQAMTRTSTMMGSPLYMSPEQMTSVKDVDARADIWALGIILFELVTGSPPFLGETLPQVCASVLQSPAPPASSRRPGLPPELDAVIHRCLAKDPAQRFQSVAELAVALQGLASRLGRASLDRILQLSGHGQPASFTAISATLADSRVSPRSAAGAVTPAPASFPGTNAAWGETRPTPPRSRAWLGVPILGVASLAAAGWWFFGRSALLPSPTAAASTQESAAALDVAPQSALAPASAPSSADTPAAPAASASVAAIAKTPAVPAAAAPAPRTPRPAVANKPRGSAPSVATSVAAPPTREIAPPPVPAAAAPEPKSSDLGGRL